MKPYLATIITVFLSVTLCKAQVPDKTKQRALSLELGKTGLIYNLNYDHQLTRSKFGFRIGAGSNFAKYLKAISFGGGSYYLFGKTTRFFEAGVDVQYLIIDKVSDDQKGFALVYPDYSTKTLYPSMNFGYRSYGKKTLFRIGISPGLIENDFVPGGYISYGLTF